MIIQQLLKVIQYDSKSIWANWIRRTMLKNACFWDVSIAHDASWIWRKVLKLRGRVLPFLNYTLGKGNGFSLWYDPWLPGGPLNPSSILLLNSGLPRLAKVQSIIVDGAWSLPDSNHVEVMDLRSCILAGPLPTTLDDSISWNNVNICKVKAVDIWHSIRHQAPKPPWTKLLWFKLNVPRLSFITWLLLKERLHTKDV